MVFVISVLSVISANPAINPLACGCLWVVFVIFVIFVIPVVFVKSTELQNIGLAKPRFRNTSHSEGFACSSTVNMGGGVVKTLQRSNLSPFPDLPFLGFGIFVGLFLPRNFLVFQVFSAVFSQFFSVFLFFSLGVERGNNPWCFGWFSLVFIYLNTKEWKIRVGYVWKQKGFKTFRGGWESPLFKNEKSAQRGSFWDGYPADIRGSFARISGPKTLVRALEILEKQAFGRGYPRPEGADVHDPKGFPKTSVRKTLG